MLHLNVTGNSWKVLKGQVSVIACMATAALEGVDLEWWHDYKGSRTIEGPGRQHKGMAILVIMPTLQGHPAELGNCHIRDRQDVWLLLRTLQVLETRCCCTHAGHSGPPDAAIARQGQTRCSSVAYSPCEALRLVHHGACCPSSASGSTVLTLTSHPPGITT